MLRAARRYVREVRKATSLRSYDVREELVLWDFRQPDALRDWDCICDRDIGGYSSASLEPNGKGSPKNKALTFTLRVHCFRDGSKISRALGH